MTASEQENKAKTKQRKVDDSASGKEASPKEVGGRGGLDPTRYGDWEKAGRCVDF